MLVFLQLCARSISAGELKSYKNQWLKTFGAKSIFGVGISFWLCYSTYGMSGDRNREMEVKSSSNDEKTLHLKQFHN